MISQTTIQKIFDTADIVEVIGDYVKLTKKGANHIGRCPFHNEKTGSFTVSPAKGIYKCFGCGEAGGVVNFVMKHENLNYPEALQKIAAKYQIEIEKEKLTEKQQKEISLQQGVKEFYQAAMEQFHMELFKPENTTALDYLLSRFTKKDIKTFKLGFAPKKWDYLLNWAKKHEYLEDFLSETGMFGIREKDNGLYDFFRGRIIFPFFNRYGQCIGFNGRIIEKDSEEPKYINLGNTPVFQKDNALFGLHLAYSSIKTNDKFYLCEGQTDVIRLHQKEQSNTVCNSGTALTSTQAKILKSISLNAHLIYDGDKAGLKAIRKNGEILLKLGLNVEFSILPDHKDPDEFFKETDPANWIEENTQDFISYFAKDDIEKNKANPARRKAALQRVGALLSIVKDEELRQIYINELAATFNKFNINKQMLKNASQPQENEEAEAAKELDADNLPDYLTKEEKEDYFKYGFYESNGKFDKNQYIYGSKGRMSNFVLFPLYHIRSINHTRKLFELLNKYNERQIIDLDMDEMTSLAKFRKAVESRGNFLFEGAEREFLKLRRKLYDKTKYCYAIENLGWQKEGFFAWANGISTTKGNFKTTDEYGIVSFDITNKDKVIENRNFFIPAFSTIYADDKSVFMDERKMEYKEGTVTWKEYSDLFIQVYQKKAIVSLAFYFTALFSDYIFNYLDNLPLLNYFGVKGSGKNEQAMTLLSLFGEYQNETQINNATKAGIAAKLESFNNTIVWFDEYKNEIPYDIIETLKGIYNRNGRTRGSIQIGIKKETTPINSMALITGQEMLTADVALFSRVVLLSYNQVIRSPEAVKSFNELKEMQKKGLSHITHNFIKYRTNIEASYSETFKEVQSEFSDYFKNDNIEERIIKNYVTILSTLKVLETFIYLPISWAEIVKIARELIIDQNDQISTSNELGQFWRIFESLVARGVLTDGLNFVIKPVMGIKLYKSGAKDRELAKTNPEQFKKDFQTEKQVLFLRWADVYMSYAEAAKKSGVKALPESTLEYYLRTSRSFLGKGDSFRFNKHVTNPLLFDYESLNINLVKLADTEGPGTDIDGYVLESNTIEIFKNGNTHPKAEKVTVETEKQTDDLPF